MYVKPPMIEITLPITNPFDDEIDDEIEDEIDYDTFREMMINHLLAHASESGFSPMSLSLLPLTLKFLL